MTFKTLILFLVTLILTSTTQGYGNSPAAPACTSTLTQRPAGCCPPRARHTATSYTACHGCALDIVTRGPQCLVACPTRTPIDRRATTTITKCAPASSKPTAMCTSVVTEFTPPCGDCGVGSVDITKEVECKGCALRTTTVAAGGFGICACPTAAGTRTISVCKPEATPY